MIILRLAWRNLWRHPRRTGLTTAADVFAVVLVLFMLAMANGSHERWIETVVRLYPGHLEVSRVGYRDNMTLDYGMVLDAETRPSLDAIAGLDGWVPRLESWALAIPDRDASIGRATRVIGIDPEREATVSRLGGAVREGRMVAPGSDREVVLGVTLAENIEAGLGDSVILLASDYYGSQSADRFRVVGLLSVGDYRFDAYAILTSIGSLQSFLEFPNGISHVAFFAEDAAKTDDLKVEIAAVFDLDHHEILTWSELLPDLVQMILLDDIGAYLMLVILVVVVAFGLLNTILMSVLERVREFGMMRALGVRPRMIVALVLTESAMITVLGLGIGLVLALPIVAYLAGNPLPMPGGEQAAGALELFGIEPVIVFQQSTRLTLIALGLLLTTSLLASLPPALRAGRGRPVDALREV